MGVVAGVCAGAFLRSPACTALVWRSTLFPLPTDAGLGILQHDAPLQKLFSNPVRGREIPGLLGGGAFRDEGFDFRIRNMAALAGGPEHVEDGVEAAEEFQRTGDVAGTELARVHGAVGVAHVLENRGQRLGSIQVVVQAVDKSLRSGGSPGRQPLRKLLSTA